MRRWSYAEPGPDGEPIITTWTEDEIRRLFYPHWIRLMHRAHKHDQITFDNCLADWITVHWAQEL